MSTAEETARDFLEDAILTFRRTKALADGALAQVGDEALHHRLASESNPASEANSLAVLIQHLAGNMQSRWTDFLTTDGEKPDRNRDGEFREARLTREELLARWEAGWDTLFGALEALTPEQLGCEVKIRDRAYTVVQAINRQQSHYAYHVGQIVLLARQQATGEWQTLSIAPGQSESYVPKGRM